MLSTKRITTKSSYRRLIPLFIYLMFLFSATLACTFTDLVDKLIRKGSIQAHITSPADKTSFMFGDPIIITSNIDNIQGNLDISWTSSIDGSLNGNKNWLNQIEVDSLSVGTHKITLRASDDNSTVRDSIKITIVPEGEDQDSVYEFIFMCDAIEYINMNQENCWEDSEDSETWICHQDIVLTNTHSAEPVTIAWTQHATRSEGEDAIDQRTGRTWTLFPDESKTITVGNMVHSGSWNWEIAKNLVAWFSTDACNQLMNDYLPTESVPDKYLFSGLPVKSPGFDNICIEKDPP